MQSNPPQYPGAPYYPMATENLLKKRYVLGLNAVALLALWLAGIIVILSGDLNARGFARFLAISGGLVGAFGSVAGSLGSKRTSDMQNLGLLVWAGLLLSFTIGVLGWIGREAASLQSPDRRRELGCDTDLRVRREDRVRRDDIVADLQIRLGRADEKSVDACRDHAPRALGLQLLRRRRNRAAGRDHVVHDADGLASDVERLRLDLHRVRIDALLHEEVERDTGDRGRLLREPKRALVGGEEHVDLRGRQVAADRRHTAHLAGRERERLEDLRVGRNGHRQEFVAVDRDVLRDRLRGDGFSLQKALVLAAISKVRDDRGKTPGTRVADCVGQKEEFDNHQVWMGRLDEDHMLDRNGAQQADVPLTDGESTGVLLESDIDETDGELMGDPASQADRRGAADDLHGLAEPLYGFSLFESSYSWRVR